MATENIYSDMEVGSSNWTDDQSLWCIGPNGHLDVDICFPTGATELDNSMFPIEDSSLLPILGEADYWISGLHATDGHARAASRGGWPTGDANGNTSQPSHVQNLSGRQSTLVALPFVEPVPDTKNTSAVHDSLHSARQHFAELYTSAAADGSPNSSLPVSSENLTNSASVPELLSSNFPGGLRECAHCCSTFTDIKYYKQHIKIHSRPYKCETCSKDFKFKRDLGRHQQTHEIIQVSGMQVRTGEFHYCTFNGCPYEKKSFTRRDNYLRHMRKQHPAGLCPLSVQDLDANRF